MGYNRSYYLKKAFALYPGVRRPRSAVFLQDHYAHRRLGRSLRRKLLDAALGLGFRAWLPFRTRAVARKFGFGREWERRTLRIARERFADPNDIALFRIAKAEELDLYLRRFEDAGLNKLLNPAGWRPGCVLADKALFARRCAERGLPHPRLVAGAGRGGVEIFDHARGEQLLAKPADGEGGSGVQLLGPAASEEELRVLLTERFGQAKGRWVVQPVVETHPDLKPITLNALPTVRIVTLLDEDGAPEVVSATFRCASDPRAKVDNMKAGGLLAPVDLERGVLGPACKGYGGGNYAAHPVTGEPIEGRTLPDWQAAKALVMQAHASAFPEYRIIGWDVALTPAGPILIEGNGKPGVLMPQRAARQGIGATRYGTLLRHNLAMVENGG